MRERLRLGQLLPLITIAIFALDLAARFVPLEWLTFRAWEAMAQYRAPCAPFRGNASYDNDRTYGDLAALGNLPGYRQYRREVFTTDRHGYRRNGSGHRTDGAYRVIVLGDSMAVGSSVDDDQTLAAKLERELGVGVYNGATPEIALAEARQILALAQRLNSTGGTVIFQYLGRRELPTNNDVLGEAGFDCHSWRHRAATWFDGFVTTSPLQIFAQQVLKQVQNDVIFPNDFKAGVVVRTLTNGEKMLFYPADVQRYRRRRHVDVSGIKSLAAELAKHKLRFLVVLVPDKYVAYEPLLEDAGHSNRREAIYLDLVEKALQQAEIPVLNLTGLLRQKSREWYERNEYLYWRDDSHWNKHGIELAAKEIARHDILH